MIVSVHLGKSSVNQFLTRWITSYLIKPSSDFQNRLPYVGLLFCLPLYGKFSSFPNRLPVLKNVFVKNCLLELSSYFNCLCWLSSTFCICLWYSLFVLIIRLIDFQLEVMKLESLRSGTNQFFCLRKFRSNCHGCVR